MKSFKNTRRWRMASLYLTGISLKKIAHRYGVSETRVRQIIFDKPAGYRKFMTGQCNRCEEGHNLEAHHIDRNRSNNIKDNIETLCIKCHHEEHRKYKLNHWRTF